LAAHVRKWAGDATEDVISLLSALPRETLCAALTKAGALRGYVREAMIALGLERRAQTKKPNPTRKVAPDDEFDDILREYAATDPPVGRYRRKTNVAPMESAAPLHAPAVNVMTQWRLERLDAFVAAALGYTSDAELLRAALTGDDVFAGRRSSVAYSDILLLLRRGYIRRVRRGEVVRTGFAFCVLESKEDGDRRRFILWPRQLNEETRRAGIRINAAMVDVEQHCVDAHFGEAALVFDLRLGFNQVGLAEAVQPHYGFVVRAPDGADEFYVSTVLVMGASTSPGILQAVTEALAREALRRAGLESTVRWRVQVDGVRFIGSVEALDRVKREFVSVCDEMGATIKAEPNLNTPHSVGVWYGVLFDYARKRVSLTPKTLNKLSVLTRAIAGATTVDDWLSLYGFLAHYSVVLQAPTHEYYSCVKFFRRLASAVARGKRKLTDPVAIWDSAKDAVNSWIEFLSAPEREACPPRTLGARPIVLFSDASLKGWGAVLCRGGLVLHIGGRWEDDVDRSNINALEALAVERAAEYFAERLSHADVVLAIDNTAALSGLKRGSARSGALNAAVGSVFRRLGRVGPRAVAVGYIASGANPADGPSRDNVFHWSQLRADIAAFMAKNAFGQRGLRTGGGVTSDGVKSG
jgi:hypothetical protein